MTTLTLETSADLIKKLWAAEGTDRARAERFRHTFVAILSGMVPPEIWEEAIKRSAIYTEKEERNAAVQHSRL